MAKYTTRDHNHSLKKLVDDNTSYRPEFCILDEVIIRVRDIAIMNRIQSRHKVNEEIKWDVNSQARKDKENSVNFGRIKTKKKIARKKRKKI